MTGDQETWHAVRELLGSKWAIHVLALLEAEDHGFNELEREVEGMTATMLSRRLGELVCHGLVDRTVSDTRPPTTTYRLTERGVAFTDRLLALTDVVELADCESTADCVTEVDGRCVTVSDTACRC